MLHTVLEMLQQKHTYCKIVRMFLFPLCQSAQQPTDSRATVTQLISYSDRENQFLYSK